MPTSSYKTVKDPVHGYIRVLFYVFIPKAEASRAQEIIGFINEITLGGK